MTTWFRAARAVALILLITGSAEVMAGAAQAQVAAQSPAPSMAASSLAASSVAASQSGGGFTPAQRAEIVDILRAALKTDPSILRDAVQALQADETLRHEVASRTAIAGAAASLAAAQGDQVAGNPSGDVTVVEFYDPRCPYCRRMLPVVADLLRHDPKLRWAYKEIPILGPASVIAAKAILAAQRQGRYAAMHDALMGGTPDITPAVVQAAAEHAGLDWPRLRQDMEDPAIKARLDGNVELARRLEIDGTPAYVIGTRLIPGAVDEQTLRAAVASARAR